MHPALGTALLYYVYLRNQAKLSLSLQPKEAADISSLFSLFKPEVKTTKPFRGKSATGICPGNKSCGCNFRMEQSCSHTH